MFITGSLGHGGAERHSITVMNRLVARGHECHGTYVKNDSSQLGRLQLGDGGSVCCLGAEHFLDLAALGALTRRIERLRPRVIVAANAYALMYASLALWRSRLPASLMVTFHSTRLLGFKEHLKMLFDRLFFASADCLVFVSDNQRRYWQRRGLQARVNEVIVNGVDIDHFRAPPFVEAARGVRRAYGFDDDDYVIGISAVLRPEKNHVMLVDAVAALRARGIPAKALMIGDGELRAAVEARARSLGVGEQVRITGFRGEVRPELAACDVLTLCSFTEALSLAALEAMAMERPVVHSDVGGASEIVIPGVNGFLFPVGELAEFVRKLVLLADRRLSRRLGRRARRVVEECFSESAMIDRYEKTLLSLSDGGPQPRPAGLLA
ncbi:hypothetical protein B9N43_07310 [Denitratisoma sp. DHT3]|uniref:glycosyltransferase n=1 Tax=Denitratisoma sp. DHT3 TaxID=1981880 RepID=UPI001198AFBB|nr:glycosyltransferase [Denitratisoma sp. DHT3]QDX81067.1 hypothetical protein B9N43_07310 [Denitratisoma sp. DHT3]